MQLLDPSPSELARAQEGQKVRGCRGCPGARAGTTGVTSLQVASVNTTAPAARPSHSLISWHQRQEGKLQDQHNPLWIPPWQSL